jgi:hypothetical protein
MKPTTYFFICKPTATTVYAVTLHCAQSGAARTGPFQALLISGGTA